MNLTLKLLIGTFLFSFLYSAQSYSQDIAVLKDGNTKSGTITIIYNEENDTILFDGELNNIDAQEIESLTLSSGEILVTKNFTYFSKANKADIDKIGFVQLIVSGTTNLYMYKGLGFSFLIEKEEEQSILLDSNFDDPTSLNNYKSALLLFLQDCLQRKEILEVKLEQTQLIGLINKYNACKDSGYVSNSITGNKTDIKSFGVEIGTHVASLSLDAPIYRVIVGDTQFELEEIGSINTNRSISNEFAFDIKYFKNFRNSKHLFLLFNFGYIGYEFNLDSEGIEVSDLESSELRLSVGPTYRTSLTRKSNIQFGASPHLWFRSDLKSKSVVYSIGSSQTLGIVVLPKSSYRSVGAGIDFGLDLSYELGTYSELFLGAKYLLRGGKNRFTHTYKDAFGTDFSENEIGDASDKLRNLYSLMIGFRLSIAREGLF
ncbi:MAG: hypothetical protein RLN90_08095 [Balneolaceae bacterium]